MIGRFRKLMRDHEIEKVVVSGSVVDVNFKGKVILRLNEDEWKTVAKESNENDQQSSAKKNRPTDRKVKSNNKKGAPISELDWKSKVQDS